MNRRWYTFLLIVILGAALFIVKRCKNDVSKSAATQDRQDPASEINRNHGFDRRISFIEYTEHAKCRMECRHISQAEVEEIMQGGKINYNKSNVKANPCPAYALEGVTKDNQRVRIVFGQCDHKTKVVTVIDLDTEWSCHCPGDDRDESGSPQKNRN
ncbi:MAG: DUF4258 domain-containing protein [Bacteroidetes bacterium]|nr:MAG: DUF4258 domain-containing protein [Bacteroidota bacterium]